MKDTLFTRLLNYYHISEDDYLEKTRDVSISNFALGHEFKRMDEAVNLVKEAIKNKDKIFIYGDYDADGIMSTSIITKSLLILGVIPLYYIPNRYNDGYGINLTKSEEIVNKGVKLVITVDNGISANEPIDYLKEHGVKVLVLDHHSVPEVVPNADVIIHPSYSEFGEVATSAGFVSFMFAWALLGRFDKYLATLASISLISDMMPLLEYNRDFLRLIFANYRDGEFYNIDFLKEDMKFDEVAIGMKIAPKINALGRLLDDETINYVVRFFVTQDHEKIDKIGNWIVNINEKRKQASKDSDNLAVDIKEDEPAILVVKDIKEGLLGLIANNLCSTYHKPTIVFTEERDGECLKGSARAPEGFNVVDAFNYCSDLMVTSGGHALAGGCSIKKIDFEKFKKKFYEFAKKTPIVVEEKEDIPLGLTEINEENYQLIHSFSPFGESWKAPIFRLKHIKTDSLLFSKSGEHILTYVGYGVKLTGFNISKDSLSDYQFVDLIGSIKKSIYRGQESIEFNIKKAISADK